MPSSNPKHFRMVIIGIGAVGEMHAAAIRDIPHATLVAGSCRTEEKGKAFAQKHGCAWYPDYDIMLGEEKPDVACICTPSGAHLEPTMACFKRGVHVLCEKPLEISTERIKKMVHAAKRSGPTHGLLGKNAQLGGIFPQRFNPVMQAVHQAAAEGRFGHVATINAYVPWWRGDDYYAAGRWQGTKELDGGGALMNQSIHMIDAVQWIASASMPYLARGVNPVEEVFGFTATRGHDPGMIEVEDTGVASLRFRSGAIGQVLGATSMFPGTYRRLQIAGRDGMAEVTEDQLTVWQFRDERPEDAELRKQFSGQAESHGGAGDPMAFSHANHTRNIEAFLKAITDGKRPELDGVESAKAVAIIEAIYRSAESGEAARVE